MIPSNLCYNTRRGVRVNKTFLRQPAQVLSFFLLLSSPSFAQRAGESVTGFNLETYRPGLDSNGILSVDLPKGSNQGTWYFTLQNSYSKGQLSVTDENGDLHHVFENLITTQILSTLAFTDTISLSIGTMLSPYQSGSEILIADPTLTTNQFDFVDRSGQHMGDTFIATKWQLYQHESLFIPDLGLILKMTLPTGSENHFLGEQNSTHSATILFGKSTEQWRWGLNVGYELLDANNTLLQEIDDRLTYGFGLAIKGPEYKHYTLELESDIAGRLMAKDPQKDKSPLETRVGVSAIMTSGLRANVAIGTSLYGATGNPDYRVIGGLSYVIPAHKKQTKVVKTNSSAMLNKKDLQLEESAPLPIQPVAPSFAEIVKEPKAESQPVSALTNLEKQACTPATVPCSYPLDSMHDQSSRHKSITPPADKDPLNNQNVQTLTQSYTVIDKDPKTVAQNFIKSNTNLKPKTLSFAFSQTGFDTKLIKKTLVFIEAIEAELKQFFNLTENSEIIMEGPFNTQTDPQPQITITAQ